MSFFSLWCHQIALFLGLILIHTGWIWQKNRNLPFHNRITNTVSSYSYTNYIKKEYRGENNSTNHSVSEYWEDLIIRICEKLNDLTLSWFIRTPFKCTFSELIVLLWAVLNLLNTSECWWNWLSLHLLFCLISFIKTCSKKHNGIFFFI